MNRSKLFVGIIALFSVILLVLNLPTKISFQSVKFPFVEKPKHIANFTYNPADLKLDLRFIKLSRDMSYRLGLDLQGGTRLTYSVNMKDVKSGEQQQAFEGARNVIERRINYLGVSEPSIQNVKIGNDYRIIVELPGMSNVEQAIGLIGQTAQLTFWEAGPQTKEAAPNQADLLSLQLSQVLGPNPVRTELSGKEINSINSKSEELCSNFALWLLR